MHLYPPGWKHIPFLVRFAQANDLAMREAYSATVARIILVVVGLLEIAGMVLLGIAVD